MKTGYEAVKEIEQDFLNFLSEIGGKELARRIARLDYLQINYGLSLPVHLTDKELSIYMLYQEVVRTAEIRERKLSALPEQAEKIRLCDEQIKKIESMQF